MLPKSVGSLIAEVSDVISDTEVRIKSEFGGDMNGTTHVRDAIIEAQKAGGAGLPFKRLPFIDQKDMYQFVYKRLSENGCLGIFPEGTLVFYKFLDLAKDIQKVVATIDPTCYH